MADAFGSVAVKGWDSSTHGDGQHGTRFQSKGRGDNAPGARVPFSVEEGRTMPSRNLPQREHFALAERPSDFLSHDEVTLRDPTTSRTTGTTNGYQPTRDGDGTRRRRGCSHVSNMRDVRDDGGKAVALFLDEPEPKPSEQYYDDATGAYARSQRIRQETEALGYTSNPTEKYMADRVNEPRRMDERFMNRSDKFRVMAEKDRVVDEFREGERTQLEDRATNRYYSRVEERNLEIQAQEYDPWSRRGENMTGDYRFKEGVAQHRDEGDAQSIPAVGVKRGHEPEQNPYYDPSAPRAHGHNYEGGGEYSTKWMGEHNRISPDTNHRRQRSEEHPSAAYSQGDMVQIRMKMEADGRYRGASAKGRTAPREIAASSNPQVMRHKQDFVDSENRRAAQYPNPPNGGGISNSSADGARQGELFAEFNEFDPARQWGVNDIGR